MDGARVRQEPPYYRGLGREWGRTGHRRDRQMLTGKSVLTFKWKVKTKASA